MRYQPELASEPYRLVRGKGHAIQASANCVGFDFSGGQAHGASTAELDRNPGKERSRRNKELTDLFRLWWSGICHGRARLGTKDDKDERLDRLGALCDDLEGPTLATNFAPVEADDDVGAHREPRVAESNERSRKVLRRGIEVKHPPSRREIADDVEHDPLDPRGAKSGRLGTVTETDMGRHLESKLFLQHAHGREDGLEGDPAPSVAPSAEQDAPAPELGESTAERDESFGCLRWPHMTQQQAATMLTVECAPLTCGRDGDEPRGVARLDFARAKMLERGHVERHVPTEARKTQRKGALEALRADQASGHSSLRTLSRSSGSRAKG